jgi:hypothetical protein
MSQGQLLLEKLLQAVMWKLASINIFLRVHFHQRMQIVIRQWVVLEENRKLSANNSLAKKYLFKEKESVDMSKGIAIETILYLLIGVLVVGIVIYLVYTYVFNPIPDMTQCRALATTWCTSCKTVAWTGGPQSPKELGVPLPGTDTGCGHKYWTAPAWKDCSDAASFCSQCCAIS